MKTTPVYLLLMLLSFKGFSQAQFNRAFGTLSNYDEFFSVCQTPDSGFAFFGNTVNPVSQLTDFFLVKTNLIGQVQWSKSFSSGVDIFGTKVACNNAGELFLVGNTFENAAPYDDIVLIKTDANGDTLWTKKYGGNDIDNANDMIIDTAGNLVIAGTTWSFGTALKSGFVIKANPSGGLIWSKAYAQNINQEFNGILNTDDGGYLMTGFTQRTTGFNLDGYVVKTDGNGTVAWSKRKGGGGTEIFYHANQDAAHNIYIAGSASTSTPSNNLDGWLVKMDLNGITTLLNNTYGSTSVDRTYNVLNYGSEIILTGHSNNSNSFENNLFIPVNMNTGAVSATPMLAGSAGGNSRALTAIKTIDGSFLEAGFIFYPGNVPGDAYVVKYSPTVSPCQVVIANITSTNQLFNFNYIDSAGSIATAANPSISSINISVNPVTINTNTFCATPVNVNEIDNASEDIEISPNPVAAMLNIHVGKSGNEPLSIKIMDISGRIIIQSLITKNDSAIPVSELKSGVYQLMIGDDRPVIKKFVKVDQ